MERSETQKGRAIFTHMRTFTNILTVIWSGTALPWLVLCLLGFAAGLWPEAMVHPKTPRGLVPLPTLPAVAAAQVGFLLLVYPVVVLRRATKSGSATHPYEFCPGLATVELAALVVMATPFYVAAAWFSDGGGADVFRTALCVAAMIPLSVGLSAWCLPARRAASRCVALIAGLVISVALPAGVYLGHEFLRPAWADTLWQTAPVTIAWTHATGTPLLVWTLIGAATIVAAWATETRKKAVGCRL